MKVDLKNRVALVSGGATGIGHTISKTLAENGANVFALDLNPEVERFSSQIHCSGRICDILDRRNVQNIVEQIINEFGKIDILVNNAGIARLDSVEDVREEDWIATMDLNLKAHFQLSQLIVPYMKQQKYGRIISLSSQASVVALDGHVAYCASKAALDAMTRVFALELGPWQITANTVAPTIVMTELGKKVWAGEKGHLMKERIPARRFGEPEDVANAVLFLASSEASLINGHTLVLDGGYTIQ